MPNTPRDPESLIFIDQTIYANKNNSPAVVWRNSEVLEMLHDIRLRVLADLTPSTLNEGTPNG